MSDQIENRVGQQFGNYRLVSLLGKGGFAEVYLGQHVFLNTQAAIKILHTQLTNKEQESFLNEARTIARLVHPNIVRVLDFGMQGDIPFLVMDYAPNETLRERHLSGTSLPTTTVVPYTKQIASALQYAHEERLIHRDVKPENMLVGRNGEILLSDFGISVVSQSSRSQNTLEVTGSVPYMAPEQIQGRPRAASDQYSLAVVVYEWLCGSRPFSGSFTEIYGAHLFALPPSLRSKNPAISPEVEQVVMAALTKDPHQRFASIHAFANALEQALLKQLPAPPPQSDNPAFFSSLHAQTTAASPPPVSPHDQTVISPSLPPTVPDPPAIPTEKTGWSKERAPGQISRRSLIVGLVGGGTVLAAGGGGTGWYLLTHPSLPPKGTIITSYLKHAEIVRSVAWLDDRSIVSAGDDKTVQVWDAANGKTMMVYRKHTDAVYTVACSPDGRRIASAGLDYNVFVWNPSDGQTLVTYTGHKFNDSGYGIFSAAWSPDGTYLATGADDSQVQVWEPTSPNGQTRYTYKGHTSSSAISMYTLSWSHDNKRIASGADDYTVQLWDALTGANVYKYDKQYGTIRTIAWSPDNQSIASATGNTITIWNINAGATLISYKEHKSTINTLSWSPDGRYIASAGEDKTIRVWEAATGKTVSPPYTHHTKAVSSLSWARDSRRLASAGEDMKVVVWVAV